MTTTTAQAPTTSKRESALTKVRKMLDLAEGSDKQGEIDAALAQAQKLMAIHAIEQAEIDALRTDGKVEQIIERKITVGKNGSPASTAAGILAMFIAHNNRCHMSRARGEGNTYVVVLVGYESDVDFCDMLLTSLTLQMDTAHNVAKRTKRDWVNGRTFRAEFCRGFANEAERRLRAMRTENEQQITTEYGKGAALVLVDRKKAAEAEAAKLGHRLRTSSARNSSTDYHARQAGSQAAARADYSGGRTRGIGARAQLGRGC